jgi:hypothetical protein
MANWDDQEKAGSLEGYDYNEFNLAYNEDTDPDSGLSVLYNGMGYSSSIINQTKS